MKKILIKSFKICTLIVLALVVCLTNFNIGKNVVKAEENLIIVAGTGKIEVEPDIAIIEIGCQTIDKEISEAVNKNNEIMKNIKEYLITSGIEENKIATKNYYIYPKYKYIALEENFIGYQVDNIIKVIIEDLDNIGIIQGVTDLGANKISNVEFACSNEEELYNEALKRAVENAKRKIEAITDENFIVKKVIEKGYLYNTICNETTYLSKQLNENIFKGNIILEANVEVTFIKE